MDGKLRTRTFVPTLMLKDSMLSSPEYAPNAHIMRACGLSEPHRTGKPTVFFSVDRLTKEKERWWREEETEKRKG